MNDDPVIVSTLQTLSKFKPKSVFLYGSRGRGDAKPDSDYEIGVIFDDDKYVQRSDIHAAITDPKVKACPQSPLSHSVNRNSIGLLCISCS